MAYFVLVDLVTIILGILYLIDLVEIVHCFTGSPFSLRVSPASLVRLRGPGLHNGVLGTFKGQFWINTNEAGPGEIKLRMGGPKGMFFHTVSVSLVLYPSLG